MKNNYPIKYAVMPLIEQTGWTHGLHDLERDYNEVAYIASKCYIVNERKNYKKNGETSTQYEVVFPFEQKDYDWKRTEPNYSMYGNCCNSVIVDKVFNTFEEAITESDIKNDDLINDNIRYIRFSDIDKLKSRISDYKERIEYYKDLEQLIEENTDDLVVDGEKKEQTIVITGEQNQKINNSLYEVIELFNTTFFNVYTLTSDEYKQLVEDLNNDLPLDKYNKQLLMANIPEFQEIRIFDDDQNDNYSLIKGCLEKNDDSFNYTTDPNITFYTLETYDDVIKSFAIKYDDDKLELGNKVIALRLKI